MTRKENRFHLFNCLIQGGLQGVDYFEITYEGVSPQFPLVLTALEAGVLLEEYTTPSSGGSRRLADEAPLHLLVIKMTAFGTYRHQINLDHPLNVRAFHHIEGPMGPTGAGEIIEA